MAMTSAELARPHGTGADIYDFPTVAVRRRAARQARVTIARRRVVVVTFLLLIVIGLLLAGGTSVSSPVDAGATPRAITVGQGDTLWDIAERYGPEGGDVRAYIYEIKQLNDLDGALAAGSRLKLPR